MQISHSLVNHYSHIPERVRNIDIFDVEIVSKLLYICKDLR
jgi:hypothetical protein